MVSTYELMSRLIINNKIKSMYSNAINLILGLALIVIPFMGLSAATFTWTLVLFGVVVTLSSLWKLVVNLDEDSDRVSS